MAINVVDLIGRAESREPLVAADGKTAAPLERIVVDGNSFVVKRLSHELDWLARAAGDVGCNAYRAWSVACMPRFRARSTRPWSEPVVTSGVLCS